MAKLRTCKICGKQYEYCSHCPSKNLIEPWRNLYCSEGCREAFEVMGKYSAGKMDVAEARTKLESFGISPNKVRDIHKAVVVDIFRKPAVVPSTPEPESVVTSTDGMGEIQADGTGFKKIEQKPPFQKSFKKRRQFEKNIVNED